MSETKEEVSVGSLDKDAFLKKEKQEAKNHLERFSVVELKALVYDQLVIVQNAQACIASINEELAKRNPLKDQIKQQIQKQLAKEVKGEIK